MDYNKALECMEPVAWNAMDVDGRLEALRAIEKELAEREGRQEIGIQVKELGVDAAADYRNRTINLSLEMLGQLRSQHRLLMNIIDPLHILEAVLHIARHINQMDRFGKASEIDPKRNPRAHFREAAERDAREYAQGSLMSVVKDLLSIAGKTNGQRDNESLLKMIASLDQRIQGSKAPDKDLAPSAPKRTSDKKKVPGRD